jgi:diguanylate cyclase (GGDEF)-like protein/PAS domain S-box-containing protein
MLTSDPDFYQDILYHIRDGVYFVDREREILFWNEGAARLTGYSPKEIVGHHCDDNILAHVDCGGSQLCSGACPLVASISDGKGHEVQVFLRHKLGHRVPVLVRVQPIRGKDRSIVGAVEIFSDNSAQTEAARKIEETRRLAFLDHLTELPNRRFMEMALQTATLEYQVHQSPFAVMVIDVDQFKDINDRFGHSLGDRVLQVIGRTIAKSLRPSDVVGRWGGDEFVAIVGNIDSAQLRALANRCAAITGRVAIPCALEGNIPIAVSIGAARIRGDESAQDLFERADRLMFAGKAVGRGCVTTE